MTKPKTADDDAGAEAPKKSKSTKKPAAKAKASAKKKPAGKKPAKKKLESHTMDPDQEHTDLGAMRDVAADLDTTCNGSQTCLIDCSDPDTVNFPLVFEIVDSRGSVSAAFRLGLGPRR